MSFTEGAPGSPRSCYGVGKPNTQGDCGDDIAFFSSLFPMPQTPGDLMVLVVVAAELQGIESPQESKL